MAEDALFRSGHSVLADKNHGAVGTIEGKGPRYPLARKQPRFGLDIQHGEIASVPVPIQDDHLGGPSFIKPLHGRVDLAGEELTGLLPTRALPRDTL